MTGEFCGDRNAVLRFNCQLQECELTQSADNRASTLPPVRTAQHRCDHGSVGHFISCPLLVYNTPGTCMLEGILGCAMGWSPTGAVPF